MSNDPRAPWWYSGDDEQPEPEAAAVAGDVPDAGDVRDAGDAPDAEADVPSPAMDWTALVAGAAKMVDWATEKVMAPHAEHTDPADHPECMVCRTVSLIGDPGGLMGGGQPPGHEQDQAVVSPGDDDDAQVPGPAPAAGAQPIRWIPIVESGN